MKKETVRTILINLISSLIFQLFMLICSGGGMIYTIAGIWDTWKDKTIPIPVSSIVVFAVCAVMAAISLVMLARMYKRKKRRSVGVIGNTEDYCFPKYEKQVTIYKNGQGIILHNLEMVVNDINKLDVMRRTLNIEDGVKTSAFPSLENMQRTGVDQRFSDFGFWFQSDEDIITGAEEYYWDPKSPEENSRSKRNPQELRWIFKFDRSRMKNGKPYHIGFSISVPGLAALRGGKLDRNLLNDPSVKKRYSSMQILHKISGLRYIVAFENGVYLEKEPVCRYILKKQDGTENIDIQGIKEKGLFYTKYIYDIEEPVFDSNIKISWEYQEI